MILGRVAGTIVATRKDEKLRGRKLLIVQVLDPETLEPDESKGYQVCVDTVGAGAGEIVITVGGSSSRFAADLKDHPVDTAIVGIVDTVDLKLSPDKVGTASEGGGS
ncbi:MAG TPA: EutN/CcmL family microcompartment protein [Acidobacteriota bacterium]|nr:EutN/CcmL family microcompartment protein [Acidobacteriota bacterium]